MKRRSGKSYGTAVILSGVFGLVGVQHFYLGRRAEGISDVVLTIGWVYCFATDRPLLALLFLGLDFLHTLVTTILLLTGSFKDGSGAIVCYPNQKLN